MKTLTETINIRCKTRTENGYEYKYVLYASQKQKSQGFCLQCYSIYVEMLRDGEKISSCEISDVFTDIQKATAFFNVAFKNLVTPIELPYVFEDMISVPK